MSHYYKDGNIIATHRYVYRDIDCDISGLKLMIDDIQNFNESVASDTQYTDKEIAQLRLQFATAASALCSCQDIIERKL